MLYRCVAIGQLVTWWRPGAQVRSHPLSGTPSQTSPVCAHFVMSYQIRQPSNLRKRRWRPKQDVRDHVRQDGALTCQ